MNIKDYVTIDDKGNAVFDNDKFTADLDRERNTASETARANTEKKLRSQIEKEVRAQIEEDAKLTAEEQLQQRISEFEAREKQFNAQQIRAMYKDGGLFSDEEVEILVENLTDDFDKNRENAEKMIATRKKYNDSYEKSLLEKFQQGQTNPSGVGVGGGDSEIEKRAKSANNALYEQNKRIELK